MQKLFRFQFIGLKIISMKKIIYGSFLLLILPSFLYSQLRQANVQLLGAGKRVSGSAYYFKTDQDYIDFINRLKQLNTITNSMIANMNEGIKKKFVHPKIILLNLLFSQLVIIKYFSIVFRTDLFLIWRIKF